MTDDFSIFWASYPRKIGKLKARTAWDRALKHATVEAILEGLERVKRGWATKDAQYIPHPTTWLSRGGWEDVEGPSVPLRATWKHHMNGTSEVVQEEMAGFYAEDGSPELEAWDRYWMAKRGVHAPRDRNFGFWFTTRWPPS